MSPSPPSLAELSLAQGNLHLAFQALSYHCPASHACLPHRACLRSWLRLQFSLDDEQQDSPVPIS